MKRYFVANLVMFFIALALAIAIGLYLSFGLKIGQVQAQTYDKEPPIIYNPKVQEVTASSALITWSTNEEADSLINFGLNKNYGMVRDPFYDKTSHSILIDDLLPDTVYYFRLTSSDSSGNQVISSDYTFTTVAVEEFYEAIEEGISPGRFEEEGEYETTYDQEGEFHFPSEEYVEEAEIVKIIEQIQQITTEEVLEIIEKTVQYTAQEITELEIIFDQVDIEVGTDYAIIRWKTSQPANSVVSLVEEYDFNPNALDPYLWEEGNFNTMTTDHLVEVNGLLPATTYHFKVSSETELGVRAESPDLVFMTKSVLPEIYNLSVYKIEEDSATITFNTNIPCSSVVEYTNLETASTKLEGDSSYSTSHSIRLTNLIFDTYYSAVAKVENEYGEKAQSSPFTFLTIKDEVPPIISKIRTESTLYPGADTKVQTIITWETDELSVCQFFYHQGLSTGDNVQKLDIEKDFAQKHVQVTTNLLPSTVYKFWVKCWDDVENETSSKDFSMLTPTREESIIDIILKNFESTFGWVRGIGGGE